MQFKKAISCALAVVLFSVQSCRKDDVLKNENTSNPAVTASAKTSISGKAQKGPFSIGTSITVYELDASYAQTGRSFFTQISDNSGKFQLNNLPVLKGNVQIRADGFYFNEVCGTISSSQISLNCIADLSNDSSLNVNILTHLEEPRVEYLLSTGLAFDSAKVKAQAEVLSIFNISASGIAYSENLDISKSGDGNAILLAVSSILQAFRTESEMSSLMALIRNDIRLDGVLNDPGAQSSLNDHASLLDTVAIKSNLLGFYSSIGSSASIPSFGKYIHAFKINTGYAPTGSTVAYPASGLYGANVLYRSQTNYTYAFHFSLAGTARKCMQVKFRLISLTGGSWWYSTGSNPNILVTQIDQVTKDYQVLDTGASFDCDLGFQPGTYSVEYYENDMTAPVFYKTIVIN